MKMYIRRYYPKGNKYNKTLSNDYFNNLVETRGLDFALYQDNANYEIIFESKKERKEYIKSSYERVMANPRWYLDNLEKLPTFSIYNRIFKETDEVFSIEGQKMLSKPKTI